MSDDAAGLHVAAELERMLAVEPIPGVTVETSTRAGFELLDLLSPYQHAILIDCIDVAEPQPGRIRQLSLQDFAGSARLVNQHELSVAAAFELAQRLGVPMPQRIEIYAIEAADLRTISESLSAEVAAAVQPLVLELFSRLKAQRHGAESLAEQPQPRRSFYDPRD
jgi:hydrogenase maturation protease